MQTRRLAVSFEGLTTLLLNQLASYGVSKWCENRLNFHSTWDFKVRIYCTPASKVLTSQHNYHLFWSFITYFCKARSKN